MNENALARTQGCNAVEHLISGNVIENQADSLRGIQSIRDRDEISGRNRGETAVSTDHRESGDSLPDLKI
jgi:hypothetical protein